jgi:hypothetical protein
MMTDEPDKAGKAKKKPEPRRPGGKSKRGPTNKRSRREESDQQTPDRAKVSDALIAAGVVVPFEQLKWTDFPLETRLCALRILLGAVARQREQRANEDRVGRAAASEIAPTPRPNTTAKKAKGR